VTRGILLFALFALKMSDSDEFVSLSEAEDSRDVSEDSDTDEDYEVDEDGLSPAVLRARLEGDSRLEEW